MSPNDFRSTVDNCGSNSTVTQAAAMSPEYARKNLVPVAIAPRRGAHSKNTSETADNFRRLSAAPFPPSEHAATFCAKTARNASSERALSS
eukprot:1163387_1